MTTDKKMSPTCSSFRSKAFVLFLMNAIAVDGVFGAAPKAKVDADEIGRAHV